MAEMISVREAESCDALQEWENRRCEKAGQSLADPR